MNKEKIREQLIIDEGVKLEIYLDHLGYPTFGIGHLITEEDPEHGMEVGTKITEERMIEAFESDLEETIKECKILYNSGTWDSFPEEVKEILVNMMFNLGRPRLSKFVNMNKALKKSDWRMAAKEGTDSRWFRQVGKRAERLMNRLKCVNDIGEWA